MACIRSISGLRVTNDELTQELIASYSRAFAAYLPPGPIVIGRDGRPSGVWMEEVIIATLTAFGRDVISLGIAPTPTVQLETEHSNAIGGISITASHNPSEWNGMKFILDGRGINEKELPQIINHQEISKSKIVGIEKLGFGNHSYQMTDIEKTIIDCFDLPQYSGGYAELIRAFNQANLNSDKMMVYCKAINNIAITKRMGYLAELLNKKGMKSKFSCLSII